MKGRERYGRTAPDRVTTIHEREPLRSSGREKAKPVTSRSGTAERNNPSSAVRRKEEEEEADEDEERKEEITRAIDARPL